MQRRRRIPKNRAWSIYRTGDCGTRHIGSEFPGRPGTCWPPAFRASTRGPCRTGPVPNRLADQWRGSARGPFRRTNDFRRRRCGASSQSRRWSPHRRPPPCRSTGSAARRLPDEWDSQGLPEACRSSGSACRMLDRRGTSELRLPAESVRSGPGKLGAGIPRRSRGCRLDRSVLPGRLEQGIDA